MTVHKTATSSSNQSIFGIKTYHFYPEVFTMNTYQIRFLRHSKHQIASNISTAKTSATWLTTITAPNQDASTYQVSRKKESQLMGPPSAMTTGNAQAIEHSPPPSPKPTPLLKTLQRSTAQSTHRPTSQKHSPTPSRRSQHCDWREANTGHRPQARQLKPLGHP